MRDKAELLCLRDKIKTQKGIRTITVDEIVEKWKTENKVPFRSSSKKFELKNRIGSISESKKDKKGWTSRRTEEHLCMALFNRYNPKTIPKNLLKIKNYSQYIVDYQTPIKEKRSDCGWGKIDLVGFVKGSSKKQFVFWEMKWKGGDNPLYASVELLAYAKVFDICDREEKLRHNFLSLLKEICTVRDLNVTVEPKNRPLLFIAGPSEYWEFWRKKAVAKILFEKLKKLKKHTEKLGFKIEYYDLGSINIENCWPGKKPRINIQMNINLIKWDI